MLLLEHAFTHQFPTSLLAERLNMTSYSLSNILLPAVFVSSAIFSTLTVPFALIKSEPVAVELPPLFSGEIQPIFNGEHKDVAIPYIGFAIVASVGAGIATVEVSRRWQAYRESMLIQKLSPASEQSTEDKEALNLPEYRPEASAIDLPIKDEVLWDQDLSTANSVTEDQFITVEAIEQVVDVTQLGIPHQTIAPSTVSEKFNFSSAPQENHLESLVSTNAITKDAVPDLNFDFSKILDSEQQYQTCRIKVPHLKQRLFAILVNGEYYSFFRSEKTKNKVLEIMAKLSHRMEKTVITKTEKGYVIWNLEPEVSSKILSEV
ncbi:MAG TPA: TetR family transcriptional regulator [Candidatus Sericytochromatia bacterium]